LGEVFLDNSILEKQNMYQPFKTNKNYFMTW